MKLSDAIREGAKLRPQGFGDYFVDEPRANVLCSCALGAAYEAVTGKSADIQDRDLANAFLDEGYDLREAKLLLPDEKEAHSNLIVAVSTLNDDMAWSREAIADYLAKQGY